jgi:hypothetical protein
MATIVPDEIPDVCFPISKRHAVFSCILNVDFDVIAKHFSIRQEN